MSAVAFVIHQSEHGLREWIAPSGALAIEIERSVIGLRDAKAVLIHEAEQAERSWIAPRGQGRQFAYGTEMVAMVERRRAAAERVRTSGGQGRANSECYPQCRRQTAPYGTSEWSGTAGLNGSWW